MWIKSEKLLTPLNIDLKSRKDKIMDKNYLQIPLFKENKKGDIVNLTNSIFYVQGKDITKDNCTIKFIMSKEAMIGFATNTLRIINSTDYKFSYHWHVDPLSNPKGNQTLGFFLTSDSPSFILMYNQHLANYTERNFKLSEEVRIVDFNFYYEVPLEIKEKTYDEYEIGFSNIMRIIVFDENMEDITKKCVNVILHIDRDSLKQMAKFLLRYSNESTVIGEVKVPSVDEEKCNYNTGIYTEVGSCRVEFELSNLGNVFDYEESFGKI